MNKKRIWTIVIVIILVGGGIILLNLSKEGAPVEFASEQEGFEVPTDLPVVPESKPEKVSEPEEIVPGGSLVTSEGEVLNEEGEPVTQGGIIPGAPEAPKQSEVIEEEEIPENVFRMEISSEKGFVPSEFRVKPGQVVTLSLTAVDEQNHILRFLDSSLRAIAISVSAGQTRAITFKAPTNFGSYEFICGLPDHRDKEKGVMFVAE